MSDFSKTALSRQGGLRDQVHHERGGSVELDFSVPRMLAEAPLLT